MEKVKYVDEDKKYEEKEALKKSKKFKKKKYEDKNEEASILKFSRQTAPIDDKSERKTKDVSSSLQSKHSKKKKHKRSKELKEADDQTIEGKRRKQKRKVKVNENEGNIEGYQGSNKEFDANEKKKENQNEKGGTEIIKKKKHKKMKKTARNISSDVSDEMKSKEVDTKKSKDGKGYDVGQWGSASFDSSEEKNKFIRLLGGFKNKRNESSNDSLLGGLKKFNSAAMNKDEEEKLNKKLETQYQQAFTISRKRKGFGLGYDASHDKTTHIDIEQPSKSIKFV